MDESGDAGMTGRRGSSAFFVVAAVLFEEDEAALDCRRRIRGLRTALRWGSRQEFKFNKANADIRRRFFEVVSPCDFMFIAVVLNKANLTGPGFKYKDSFYKYATKLVFLNARPHLNAAVVIMDQCGSRDFRDQMQSYLRKQTQSATGDSPIRAVRTEKSHACELVQLADMVVGAVARSFRLDRGDAGVYRKMLAHRELDVQHWPR